MAVEPTATKIFRTLELAETGLRLAKVGQFWCQIGFKACGDARFRNCEQWLGKVSVGQNFLRLEKAAKIFHSTITKQLHKEENNLDRKTILKNRRTSMFVGEGNEDNYRISATHLNFLSALTLAVVSSVSIINFLGKEKILILPSGFKVKIDLFGTYGGGLWGNGIAAYASYRSAASDATSEKIEDKDRQEKVDYSSMACSKYTLDLVATIMDLSGIHPTAILAVKGFSNHLAIAQSFRGVVALPGWQMINSFMGLQPTKEQLLP